MKVLGCGRLRAAIVVAATIALAVSASAMPAVAAPSTDRAVTSVTGSTLVRQVFGWGSNSRGQLGGGATAERRVPARVAGLPSDITQIDTDRFNSLALRSDGTVWAWGDNEEGQLGDGSTTPRSTAEQVFGLSGVVQVAAGKVHSLALRSDGTVWAWGDNQFGQLGDGTRQHRLLPGPVPGLTGVMQVVAEEFHTLALLSNGSVWGWGGNSNGVLGNGGTGDQLSPEMVQGLPFVTQLAAGRFHTMALLLSTLVYAWGSNRTGRLGDGTTTPHSSPAPVQGLSNIRQIAAGLDHSVALRDDGMVLTWGDNQYGQMGDGTVSAQPRLLPAQVPGLAGVTTVAAGWHHTMALRSGELRVWGLNDRGQLGDGTINTAPAPKPVATLSGVFAVAANGLHSMALTGPPDFGVSVSPTAGLVFGGAATSTTVSVTPFNGFTQPVTLSATGLPVGVAASFNPPTVSAGTPSTLTLSSSSLMTAATFTVTVAGSSGGAIRTAPYALTVVDSNEFGCSNTNTDDIAIPDNGPPVTSPMVLFGCDLAHAPTMAVVDVHIVHPRGGDLVIDLVEPDGTAHRIKDGDPTGSTADVNESFVVDLGGTPFGAVAAPAGQWRLRVHDIAAGNTGTIDRWTLTL